jgi:hypothetical protein
LPAGRAAAFASAPVPQPPLNADSQEDAIMPPSIVRIGLPLVPALLLAAAGLAVKPAVTELAATFVGDLPEAMIRQDDWNRPYVSRTVDGSANRAYISAMGLLQVQVLYPGAARYVDVDFSRSAGGPGAYHDPGASVLCTPVDGAGPRFPVDIPPFLWRDRAPGPPALYTTQPPYATRAVRMMSGREWTRVQDPDTLEWSWKRGGVMNLRGVSDAPRYADVTIDFDTPELNAIGAKAYLAFDSRYAAPDVVGTSTSLLKVVRTGSVWTITPIPAGEAGIVEANIANLTIRVPTPDKRVYTSGYATCPLGSFVMPFELTLTER